MRIAWIIARKDLALRSRDRSVFVIAFVAPLALAFIFNLVFGGGGNDIGQSVQFDYGIVDRDDGPVSQAFTEVLEAIEADGLIAVQPFDIEPDARAAVEDGTIDSLFILPSDLSANITTGLPANIEVVGNVDTPTSAGVAASIAERFASGLAAATDAALTAVETGVIGPDEIASAAAEAGAQPPVAALVGIDAGIRLLDSATFFVAGLSIFFMFFVAGLGVTSMLEERRDGTMTRLIAAPIRRSSIIGGKALSSVLIGLVAMVTLVVASTLLMGANWGDPAGVLLLIFAAVLAVVALMSFVGGLAKTTEQSGNLQGIVAVTLGMLGGTFVPIGDPTSFLGQLRFLTPNAWFLRGLADLGGGNIVDTLPAVGVLLLIALGFGVAAVSVARKVVSA